MCESHYEYNDLPSVTIGGPAGDYLIPPQITSNEFLEFFVVCACAFTGNATVQVSGVSPPKPLDTTGNSIYNGENPTTFIKAQVLLVPSNNTIASLETWEQVSSANMHTFVRIDATGGTVCFVTIKQRVKVLKRIPAPFVTNNPSTPEDTHLAREERILTAVYGTEGRITEYGREPGKAGTVRELTTGPTGYSNAWGKWNTAGKGQK